MFHSEGLRASQQPVSISSYWSEGLSYPSSKKCRGAAFGKLHWSVSELRSRRLALAPSVTLSCTVELTKLTDYGFGCRPAVFAPLLGKGIFTQEGAAWKHSRELLRKQFIRTQYRHLGQAFGEHVDNLLARIPDQGVVDLQPLFFALTLDTTTALLFGDSVYSLRAGRDQAAKNRVFAESFNIAQEGLAKRFRLAPFHYVYNPHSFRQACRNAHKFVEEYIKERGLAKTKSSERPGADDSFMFIDQVAADSASEIEIRDQLLNVLLAGRDTVACCLSWCL